MEGSSEAKLQVPGMLAISFGARSLYSMGWGLGHRAMDGGLPGEVKTPIKVEWSGNLSNVLEQLSMSFCKDGLK